MLDGDRGDHAVRRGDGVHEAAFDPQPALVVVSPNVTTAMPPRGFGTGALGHPEPVVRFLHVRRPDTDLADHRGLGRQPAGGASELIEGADGDLDRGQGQTDAHAALITGSIDLGQADIGNRQDLRHSVRRVKLGLRHQSTEGAKGGGRDRGTGREKQSHLSERARRSFVETARRGEDVGERGRRGEHEARPDRSGGGSQRHGVQRPRGRDLHCRDDGGDAHRRAIQGKRRKGGDQAIARTDVVRRHEHIALGLKLAVPVHHALGGAGGTRGERDRSEVARVRGRGSRGARTDSAELSERRLGSEGASGGRGKWHRRDPTSRPPECPRGCQGLGNPDQVVGIRAPQRPSHPAESQTGIGDTTTAPIRQQA